MGIVLLFCTHILGIIYSFTIQGIYQNRSQSVIISWSFKETLNKDLSKQLHTPSISKPNINGIYKVTHHINNKSLSI